MTGQSLTQQFEKEKTYETLEQESLYLEQQKIAEKTKQMHELIDQYDNAT